MNVLAVPFAALVVAAPQDAAAPAKAVTLESLKVPASELPAGWKLLDEVRCVSVQARTLYDGSLDGKLFPTPKAKAVQTIDAGKGSAGSVLLFEYAEPIEPHLAAVRGLVWGGMKQTRQHPEDIAAHDRFLVVLSFPMNAEEAEFAKDRLRAKLPLRLPRSWKSLESVFQSTFRAQTANQPDVGLAELAKHENEIAKCSFAQFLRGELYAQKQEYAAAEKAYARALELDQMEDPILGGDPMTWAALDGLAIALIAQGRAKDSIPLFEKGAALARANMDDKSLERSLYNLACAYSETSRFDDALKTLTECLRLNPSLKAQARQDSSFEKALQRKDFQDLLK
jgi:tetratricopeptide (TPR) repeat protein